MAFCKAGKDYIINLMLNFTKFVRILTICYCFFKLLIKTEHL